MSWGGGGWRTPHIRRKTIRICSKFKNIRWMVVTPDLIADFPKEELDATVVPRNLPVTAYRRKYDYTKQHPPLIVHSPSGGRGRPYKNASDAFQFATQNLQKYGFTFTSWLVYNLPNTECLAIKAHASIFQDKLESMYGFNSMEAACFESVVLAYTSEATLQKIRTYSKIPCPFISVQTKEKVYNKMAHLLTNPEEMSKIGKKCYRYVKAVHDGRISVKQFMGMIE